MHFELRVVTGSRAGMIIPVTSPELLIGRHASATLRFDPAIDLAVSSRHAIIERKGDVWWLRDLGSTNGTLLNGSAIASAVLLNPGDQITFGNGGPQVEWRLQVAERESTTSRIRAHVGAQMRKVRLALFALVVLVAVGAGFLIRMRNRQQAEWLRERAAMQKQIDSLLTSGQHAVSSLQGEMRGLSDALRSSETRVRQVSLELDSARRSRRGNDQTEELRRQLQAALEALRRQQLAASLDFRDIDRKNRHAVALIYSESDTRAVSTATAFAVRSDGLMITSRHVVSDSSGKRRPRRLAVQFTDSDQIWDATVVAVSSQADLALIRVHGIVGNVPTVHRLNTRADTIPTGSPTAVIGFPLGGENSGSRRAAARPLLSAAIVRSLRPRFELEGYGAAGASGSPIIDRNGEVIGVLYGGYRDTASGTSIIMVVPIAQAFQLLTAN